MPFEILEQYGTSRDIIQRESTLAWQILLVGSVRWRG